MRTEWGNAVLVQLYAPVTCNTHAMLEMSKFAGGCTIIEGKGEWLHNKDWANEAVRKYEWVVTEYVASHIDLAERLCKAFLNDNPTEVEALCTVSVNSEIIYVRCTRE